VLRLSSIANGLRIPADDPRAWKPAYVAEKFRPRAEAIFAKFDERARRFGSSVLLVGAEPKADIANSFEQEIHVIRLESPHFRPGFSRKRLAIRHIGSGAARYKKSIKPLFEIRSGAGAMQMETAHKYGWVTPLTEIISSTISENPMKGVSPHLHILVCSLGHIAVGTNDRTIFTDKGAEEFQMPQVAQSYSEFAQLCAAQDVDAAEAAC
jgi:hypothetical protein